MEYTDLFLLSFLSKKVKKLIKSSQVNRSKKIDYIMYDCDHAQEILVYVFYKNDWNEKLLLLAKHDDTDNDCHQLSVSGKMIDIHSHDANKEILENFFTSSPTFKWINIWAHGSTEPANPESKFYQAESIQILQLRHNSPDVLRHFQGKQAVLKCCECEVLDVISFLNRWKSGDAYLKLEYLSIQLFEGEFPQNEILNSIGAKHIDETNKPPTHCLPKVYIDYHSFCSEPNTDPFSSHAYVVRVTDNCVASVSIQEKLIYFGVWNKTEDEFLKMIE
ncbi:hypothetical protein B9Z55_027515 [Caenorhabditis nigoni]|nr:hypothetical protein B9Z55_027515 [Caenorhabditis nigoni]